MLGMRTARQHNFHKPSFSFELFNSYELIQGTIVTIINKNLMLSFSKCTICHPHIFEIVWPILWVFELL